MGKSLHIIMPKTEMRPILTLNGNEVNTTDNEIIFRIKVQSATAKNKIVRTQADALKIKMLSLQ